uniref:AlNc14C21G2153 protein n=1 Tax=Albugo laibachii Nc14 TaxID=890382 RepID=F0W5I8_9STRA|nr:AlNc14C21G2153 [Albugo laibachii Nc14]|eukprot:CCA16379.1 AlNc14C21G2153 [Albugo laibachii Nc14]
MRRHGLLNIPFSAILCSNNIVDRQSLVKLNFPADCCEREFPIDYVREALSPIEFVDYKRFLDERRENWQSSTLISDQEYKSMIQSNGW